MRPEDSILGWIILFVFVMCAGYCIFKWAVNDIESKEAEKHNYWVSQGYYY